MKPKVILGVWVFSVSFETIWFWLNCFCSIGLSFDIYVQIGSKKKYLFWSHIQFKIFYCYFYLFICVCLLLDISCDHESWLSAFNHWLIFHESWCGSTKSQPTSLQYLTLLQLLSKWDLHNMRVGTIKILQYLTPRITCGDMLTMLIWSYQPPILQ